MVRLSLIEKMAWSQDLKEARKESAVQVAGEWAGHRQCKALGAGQHVAGQQGGQWGPGQVRAVEVLEVTENQVTQAL